MTTQSLPLQHQTKSNDVSPLALVFFFLGAPHIYSFFKKRAERKAEPKNVLFWQTFWSLMGCGVVGTASAYLF